MGEVTLRESGGMVLKETNSKKGIFYIKVISADVQGSSGYYPAEVLERDGARAFPAGTHMFLDHPTATQKYDHPERSVKDLAAYFTEDVKYLDQGPDGPGLYVHAQVLPHHLEFVESIMGIAGVSIVASGISEYNRDADREEVTAILHGESVDIVTRAGAGGRVLEMSESARNAGKESPIFAELSESDRSGMQKLFEAFKSATASVETLTKKVTELEEKAAVAEKKSQEENSLSIGELVAKLDDSGLPGVVRRSLADSYTPEMDLDAAIKTEQDRVEAIKAELGAQETSNTGTQNTTHQESNSGVGRVQESNTSGAYDQASNIVSGLFG